MIRINGFTLIELSIVLIIISLIVGGIVGGKSLIKSAKIAQFTKDILKNSASMMLFRDQYDYFPGDIPNAQEYWPQCLDSGLILCNGNGNGLLNALEPWRAFEHLSLAEFVDKHYEYLNGAENYQFRYEPSINNGKAYGEFRYYASIYGTSANFMSIPYFQDVLDVSDVVKIDKKIDDGSASKDKFVSIAPSSYSSGGRIPCVDASYTALLTSANYILSNNGASCWLLYRLN